MVKAKEVEGSSRIKIEQKLIENFVSLQKIMADLSQNFNDLTDRIDKLLEVFEVSAKSLAEKDFDFDKSSKDISEKVDKLIDQNKTIARSLSTLSENKDYPPRPSREL